jgi:hypothetical protein
MAKSQSESPLRLAFSLVSLRGAEGDEAISRVRQGEQENAWPGQKSPTALSSPLKGEER